MGWNDDLRSLTGAHVLQEILDYENNGEILAEAGDILDSWTAERIMMLYNMQAILTWLELDRYAGMTPQEVVENEWREWGDMKFEEQRLQELDSE